MVRIRPIPLARLLRLMLGSIVTAPPAGVNRAAANAFVTAVILEPLAAAARLVAELDSMLRLKFCQRRLLSAGLIILFTATGFPAAARPPRHPGCLPPHLEIDTREPAISGVEENAPGRPGVSIVQHGGYPELQVDGRPFFIHSAAFFYARIPRSLWESTLDRYREFGINTVDLYIPWNWHEPQEGEFDFDGHSNPRRDLRSLLQLLTRKGFRCIARPGPTILNEWRHGGYPEWLLERPEYAMPALDRIEGRYPPLANLNSRNAEAAARGWLDNPVHMAYASKWLTAVARELAPYRASQFATLRGAESDQTQKKQPQENAPQSAAGPLLFVQLEDDMALGRFNTVGPAFWRYLETLRGILEAGGLDTPAFINPEDMRVTAAGFGLARPIAAMGQWYLRPSAASATERILNAEDASSLEFFVEELKTQPAFPPLMIEYQAGWYAPGDDSRPPPNPASNTLLSTRLLLAHGLHGLNYFPLQDTLFPAGYETPWTNRHYRWDAALSLNGFRQARARAVERTGDLLELWGSLLAASHKRADFGLIYPLGAFSPNARDPGAATVHEALGKEDIAQISQTILRLERLAHLAGLASELLDPEYQPVEQLMRDPILLLPVFDADGKNLSMSDRAQRALVEYVRRGGMLVTFPAPPQGAILGEMWKARPAQPRELPSGARAWPFGAGQVLAISKDFYTWVAPEEDFATGRARFEADWAISALRGIFEYAKIRPAVDRLNPAPASSALVITELASNEGTGLLGERSGGSGLLSVTNLNPGESVEALLDVLSPRAGAAIRPGDTLRLRLTLPPHESLLLPIHFSLCTARTAEKSCDDEVTIASAELLRVERSSKTLELSFYAPSRASARLRLRERPSHLSLDEGHLQANWNPDTRELEIEIPRGVAPDFKRVLQVHLPYIPAVPERPEIKHAHPPAGRLLNFSAVGAVRLPLGEDTSLLADPPLFSIPAGHAGDIVFAGENLDESSHDMELRIDGPLNGAANIGIPGHEWRSLHMKLHPEKLESLSAGLRGATSGSTTSGTDPLLQGHLTVSAAGHSTQTPVYFVVVPEKGATGYRFDFDRDANPEWVLENSGLRLIVSPEDGGRAVALVDKASGANLASTVGFFADHFAFTPNPPGINPVRAHGRYGLFNRNYRAEWLEEQAGRALRLSYRAPDVAPAGARIEKTIRLLEGNRIAVDYDVVLETEEATSSRGAVNPFAAPLPAGVEQAFVAVNSVATHFGGAQSTLFCWPVTVPPPEVAAAAGAGMPAHCETFAPGRALFSLPPSASRLEVRTLGKPTLVMEWTNAVMTVEMKIYSALLRLEFPKLRPGGASARPHVEFTLVPAE